jgi:hypothetical protein
MPVETHYTETTLRDHHDPVCPKNIGDGDCRCLVRAVLELQRVVDQLTMDSNGAREHLATAANIIERLRKALEEIKRIDGPGCDGSPAGPCYDIAVAAIES